MVNLQDDYFCIKLINNKSKIYGAINEFTLYFYVSIVLIFQDLKTIHIKLASTQVYTVFSKM